MSVIASLVLVLHLLAAAAICGFVLLQHGKGADMGAAFGSGSSGSVFGAAGSANFLSRTTAILAVVFFSTSIALTAFSSMHSRSAAGGLMDRVAPATTSDVPAKSADAPAGNAAAPASGSAAPPGSAPKSDVPAPAKSSEVPK
ncbi:MAG: preprotein translocase subunit SecG [Proteobacteria bacterium]|nr:preprotein translocase subunit SecG [Pseudomonadota bacterium]